MKHLVLLGCITVLVSSADLAAAKTPVEIESMARSTAIKIGLAGKNVVGSGVIIHRQGDLYTLVTNRHVVCGSRSCTEVSNTQLYDLTTMDGQQHQVSGKNVKLVGHDLDLAIIQFRSSRTYPIATISTTNKLKAADNVYTAGFPANWHKFSFNAGRTIAVVNKRLTTDGGGYSIIYNAFTWPGMSGSGVFDDNGQLVAIHGQGDRVRAGTVINDDSQLNSKIGVNRGIPIRWLVQNLQGLGINLPGTNNLLATLDGHKETPTSADEHFIAGFNKFAAPGDDVVASKREAIQELTQAIKLNPQYVSAYFVRGYVYGQLQNSAQAVTDYQQAIAINPQYAPAHFSLGIIKYNQQDLNGALSHFDQAINANPKYTAAYYNRGLVKYDLKNVAGALNDYNQALSLNPEFAEAYSNRGIVKYDLKDLAGALSDYNRAISINPKFAEAYYNRGNVRKKQNDLTGALADFNQAITSEPKFAEAYYHRGNTKFKMSDVAGAVNDFDQAISINPKYGLAYYNRGIAKSQQSNSTEAVQDFRQAAKIFRQQKQAQYLQLAIEALAQQGVGE
jgi:tetratricopeptide (TPR) repeat protein